MPLKIVRTPDDPHHSRAVVYVPELPKRAPSRPRGTMTIDKETHRLIRPEARIAHTRYLGLDLGQAADWTALALVERRDTGYIVPYLDRVKGLPYPQIVLRVADLMDTPQLKGTTRLVVDATGVGRPVLDMLRSSSLSPLAVTIHGGERTSGGFRNVRVPKRDLVNGILVAFQAGTIRISNELPHAPLLASELREMRRKVSAAGHDSYGVWRDGEHDDLVLALAMAVWAAERKR